MKNFKKISVFVLAVSFAFVEFGLTEPIVAQAAATAPDLKTAANFSILAGAQITNTGASTVSGNVGGPSVNAGWSTVTLGGTFYGPGGVLTQALSDRLDAYTALDANACGAGGLPDWSGTVHSLDGAILTPGTYCATEFDLSGTLTLNGSASDVWVFKSSSSLVVSGGAAAKVVFTGGGQACNVWWRVVSTASFDANSTLSGNILADTSITFAAGSSLNGRALARSAAVTLSAASITGPTCEAAAAAPLAATPSSSGTTRRLEGTIKVVKVVINDNGRTKTITDFPLFFYGAPIISGETNAFVANGDTVFVTEINDANYIQSFSGDCNSDGSITLTPGSNYTCIITNNDIGAPMAVPPVPPIIDVVKVPEPLALPDGRGAVVYTYTVRNIGTVPMTDVTLVGDTCSPITLASGDSNGDAKLDVKETWVYRCSTTLSATHTNTVVATGWANGISAVDIASATVVVGEPVVPPLIHVTKVPNPLALSAGAGMVTYTEKITNPGTAALSNVKLTDDKCSPMKYISGDTNKNSKLETNETWVYTCRANLTKTTTNTAAAEGEANGLVAKDFAIATVVVAAAVPKLPNTGLAPLGESIPWNIVVAAGSFAVLAFFYFTRRKQTV